MQRMENAFQLLAAPRRREILRIVWSEERTAGDILRAMPDVTFGAISQHLRQLEHAGLVARRRNGRFQLYKARKQALGPLRAWLEEMWADSLHRLKVQAELAESRRGPRPRSAAAPPATQRSSAARRVSRTTTSRRKTSKEPK